MLEQMSLLDLVSAIQNKVETRTGLKCYDAVPKNPKAPFYFAEAVGKRSDNTKSMYRDVFTVYIHCIAKPSASSVEVYKLIRQAEEALTEDIEIPQGFELLMQNENGIQTIKTDETNEKHAVISYDFTVCYGFKTKI